MAAASANTVYVANGAGSGSWTTISNPFSTSLLHVRDQVASGTVAQGLASATWTIRRLQTVLTNEIAGTSLASNQIVDLPSGTYYVDGKAAWHATETSTGSSIGPFQQKLRLRNVTDSTDLLISMTDPGHGIQINPTGGEQIVLRSGGIVPISGRFTITGTKTLELQHNSNMSGVSTYTGGFPVNIASTVEVYADLMIWKL